MKKQFKLTKDGVEELKAELNLLISQRVEITERIKSARELGDLAENSEYSSARSEQDRTEARITEIEHILNNVKIITTPKHNHQVCLGSHVRLTTADHKIKEFQVVGTVEADPLSGKVSDESPIGRALMGKKMNETVEIANATETISYTVTEIF